MPRRRGTIRNRVTIRTGKVKPIIFRHPWIYSGSIKHADAGIEEGEFVDVFDEKNNFLARGCFNSSSQIAVRIVSWDPKEEIDRAFFERKIRRAVRLRREIMQLDERANCYRVIHSEADELPGLIVDRYQDHLVIQITCKGMSRFMNDIVDILNDIYQPQGIYERVDRRMNELEGMNRSCQVLSGGAIPEEVIVEENGLKYIVNLQRGQKTGFFADQRDNRAMITPFCKDKDVLDAFCYTGAFALNAAKAGARSVIAVDTSQPAIELGRRNSELNDIGTVEFIHANAIQYMRTEGEREPRFDVIVLDPPKLAPSRKDVDKALRKYGEANRLAMQCLRDGGILMTCSCSHHINDQSFDRMLAECAISSGRTVQILNRLGQAPDHPTKAGVEEGNYLKARLCRVSKS